MNREKLEKILTLKSERNILLNLIRYGRRDFDNSIEFIDFLNETLETNPKIKKQFVERLRPFFRNIIMQKFITDLGIFSEDKLISLLFRQIGNKILPQISDDQTLLSLTNEVLYSKDNYNFVRLVPIDRWRKFYEVLFSGDEVICNKEYVKKQIREGAIILMNRIAGGAADIEVLKLSYIRNVEENPFQKFAKSLFNKAEANSYIDAEKIEEFNIQINQCHVFLDNILDQKEKKGISLKITVKITKLRQQLDRISVLLNALNLLDTRTLSESIAHITKNCLSFYSPKSSVTNSFQSTLYVITFLITWYNRQTGEKYITSTLKEYLKLFYAAVGGGVIVSILCLIKNYLGTGAHHTPFSQALLYSLNYAWGFVSIYLLHWVLATKQPAMTAAALAHTLNQDEKSANDYKEFGVFFSRLFRSQFISFIGNVAGVFALCSGLYYFLICFTTIEFITDEKAKGFIKEVVEWDPAIFWYASIAGVFLFVSGLVTGLKENRIRYYNVAERLYNHPLLKKVFRENKRRKIVNWYENKIGGITGNVVFGFCMGCAFLIGNFLGIPFDVRHITFSAGNYAIALLHFGYDISLKNFLIGVVGIFGIGAFNFLVSFSLSLWVAMKSVNVPTREIGKILYSAFKLFIKNPLRFFIPLK